MERLTQKTPTGYTAPELSAALNRLGRWEDLYEGLSSELEATAAQMRQLSQAGKTGSATYRQLFARKLTLTDFLSRLDACR